MKKKPSKKTKVASKRARPPAGVELTHPERVVFPAAGLTKADVFAFYDTIAPRLLPFLKDRPVTLACQRVDVRLPSRGPPIADMPLTEDVTMH